jgi:DNA topoisomerase II
MVQSENIEPRKRSAAVYEGMDESFLDDDSVVVSDNDSDFGEPEPVKKSKTSKGAVASKVTKAAATKTKKAAAPRAKKPKVTEPLHDVEINEVERPDVGEPSGSVSPAGVLPGVTTKVAAPTKAAKSASANYQKLTHLEQVLKRPDTYIGSVEHTESQQWIFNESTDSMELKEVSIVPGLFKIFDEILVNAADNKIRDPSMDTLRVDIDAETNTISIYNNGRGIPIEIHEKEGIYIPELIFGHLLTSSNYDDDEKKVTGGRNGYGAKVCNVKGAVSCKMAQQSVDFSLTSFVTYFLQSLLLKPLMLPLVKNTDKYGMTICLNALNLRSRP